MRKKLDEVEFKNKDLLVENENLNKLVKIKNVVIKIFILNKNLITKLKNIQECDKLIQKLENEANLKVKNEIDANYVKSLRYTVKKLFF